MASIITSGSSTITPSAVTRYESTRDTGAVVHPIINRAAPDATLRVASLRKGRLEITFLGASAEADSDAAEEVLATAATFSLVSADRLSVQMSFVLPKGGRLTRTLSDTTRAAWVVAFDWVEVAS